MPPSAPSAPSPELLALQQAVLGRYALERELGRGGMGVVFLARDLALDRPVAIKLLPPALAEVPALRERFLREARAAARLSHPHIVPVHAVEERGALVFFVMASVDGETLGERVRRDGPLPPAQALRVVQEVAWALAHAHAHGVVHRDVKPDNILLEREGGRALVTDFGIAHVARPDAVDVRDTPAGGAVGTPQYMSPEQAAGEPPDARADLYALGVTAFVASAGRLPFEGGSVAALLAQHAAAAPPPLLALRPSLPPRFAALVDRCLAKDPAARPPSAEALAVALGDARGTLPATPAPVRAFLRDAGQAGGEIGTALTAGGAAMVGATLLLATPLGGGLFDALAGLVYSGTAVVATTLAGVRAVQLLASARALLRRGYGHAALAPALQAETDEREADREAERLEPGAARAEGAARRERRTLAGIGAVKSAVAFWLVQAPVPSGLGMLGLAGSIVVPTAAVRMLWRDWPAGRRVWTRLVGGAAGRAAFRVAGIGLAAAPRAVGAEPTLVALGRAADDLFAQLPAAQQARLGDVPALVARLRAEADRLALRTTDPGAAERRALTVAALEAVRLDLLKLHAGAGSLDELTRDVEAAQALGRRIDAELVARAEVRGLVGRGEATPV